MKPRYPTIRELAELIVDLKKTIGDDYRGSSYEDPYIAETSSIPTMDVTIGWSPDDGSWNYQTGDNSYSGGAYLHPIWAVAEIDRRSSSREIARDLIAQLADQYWQTAEC